jgi:hypothetical protein
MVKQKPGVVRVSGLRGSWKVASVQKGRVSRLNIRMAAGVWWMVTEGRPPKMLGKLAVQACSLLEGGVFLVLDVPSCVGVRLSGGVAV